MFNIKIELIIITVYISHCSHGFIWNRIIYNRNNCE